MKKFKKVLLGLCCCLMLVASCFCLTACDVKENTTTAVNSATDLLPYEYSKAAATNILTSAYANSLKQDFYKSVHQGKSFVNGIEQQGAPVYELYSFTKNGKKALAYCEITNNTNGNVHFITKIEDTTYDLDITAKTYSTNINNCLTYSLVAQKSAIANVISGKYYKGADHIYGVLEGAAGITYYEWVIKDGLIVEINQFVSAASGEFNYGYMNQTFEYVSSEGFTESDFPEIPASLDGFEQSN